MIRLVVCLSCVGRMRYKVFFFVKSFFLFSFGVRSEESKVQFLESVFSVGYEMLYLLIYLQSSDLS